MSLRSLSPEPEYVAACPDCPAARTEVLQPLVGATKDSCRFQTLTIEARAPIPARWFDLYGLGLVRRGVVIRQRMDAQGRASAVDAAGPGCAFLLRDPRSGSTSSSPSGYAATRVLVCVCPADILEESLSRADSGAASDLLLLHTQALERVERIADARGRTGVMSRVAALICTLADMLTPPMHRERIPADLQQRDLAHLLGVRHETVCRALGTLEKQGAIVREAEGIRITDQALLESL